MSTQSTFEIQGLRFDAIIGVDPWEKLTPQPLIFDVLFHHDTQVAAQTDDLQDTVDYSQIPALIESMLSPPVALLETLLERIATHCLTELPLDNIQISVKKPAAISQADHVKLTITRTKAPTV